LTRLCAAPQICTALTRQCTIPPSTSTLKALAVFSYLLKRAQETTATNEYGAP
jgi:hypothetical protein